MPRIGLRGRPSGGEGALSRADYRRSRRARQIASNLLKPFFSGVNLSFFWIENPEEGKVKLLSYFK